MSDPDAMECGWVGCEEPGTESETTVTPMPDGGVVISESILCKPHKIQVDELRALQVADAEPGWDDDVRDEALEEKWTYPKRDGVPREQD